MRMLDESDIPVWEDFFIDNPNLDYLGLNQELAPRAQSSDWIERQLARYENYRFGHQALIEKSSGAFIGQAGLLTQEIAGTTEIEIGYHILPDYWGKGFATEAAIAFRKYAFENAVSSSLVSVIDIRNKASQNVAQKIGMRPSENREMFTLNVCIYRINTDDLLRLRRRARKMNHNHLLASV